MHTATKLAFKYYVLMASVLFVLPTYAQDLSNLAKQDALRFNGGMELRGIFYNASGIANRRSPASYLLSGTPTLSLYGWSIPFTFIVSEQERSFRQPFNQFGVSPNYKWVTLHAGYRNISFNPFTLAGHTMLGGGFELNPGKLRLGIMAGRLNRATVIDTTTQALVPFSFSRKGWAAKLGYGTAANYFDLSFLKATDDSTSGPGRNVLPAATNVLPAANVSLGYSTRLVLAKKIFFESDGAVSAYTTDVNSPIQFDSLENQWLKSLRNFLPVNGTTEWYTAFSAAIGYKEKHYGVKLGYRRIDPDYKTMGAYFFANDVENWTVAPNFVSPSGKIRANASVGVQRDNVKNQKEATNRRFIGAGNLSAEISERWGIDLNYTNFSNNQKPNTVRFADSLKIVQTTQSYGVSPRYTIGDERFMHLAMLSVNFSQMNDYNGYFEAQANNRNIRTAQYFFNYNLSFLSIGLSLFASLNFTKLSGSDLNTRYQGLSFGGNYAFWKQKAQAGMSNSIMQGKTQGNTSLIINSSANLAYRVNKNQAVKCSMFLTNNNPGSTVTGLNPAFTETRGELAYQINF